jgi:hypothetical protein
MTARTRNLRHGELSVIDGSGTPKVYNIKIAEGDFAFEVTKNAAVVMNRGKIDHRTQGDEAPMSLSLTLKFEQYEYDSAETGLSPVDVLLGSAIAKTAGWVSSDGCGDAWAVTFVLKVYDPCDTTRTKYEQFEFPDFHTDKVSFKEGADFNTLAITGTSLATEPTITWVEP